MQEIIIKTKSSNSSNFYNVTITNENGIIKLKCDCRAGIFSWVCRHKLALLQNDATILFDPSQDILLNEVVNWINKSSFPNLIIKYNETEIKFNAIKKYLKKIEDQIDKDKVAIYESKANSNDPDNKNDADGNVFRFDLLKTFLEDIKSRDQKYYKESNPYNNPVYARLKTDFLKSENDFKSIKSILKSVMIKGG